MIADQQAADDPGVAPRLVPTASVARLILAKDLRVELRTLQSVPAMVLFAVTTFVLFRFGLDRTALAGSLAAGVLLASAAFLGWFTYSGDLALALQITVAVLVVTCPCGLGIASPLAYRLAAMRLRRAGLFLRRERALDRACDVREIILDKTGTVTTGTPEVEDLAVFEGLEEADRAQLENLVGRSAHPTSAAIPRALGDAMRVAEGSLVREVPGRGLEAHVTGPHGVHRYRLGTPGWAAPDDVGVEDGAELVFGVSVRGARDPHRAVPSQGENPIGLR